MLALVLVALLWSGMHSAPPGGPDFSGDGHMAARADDRRFIDRSAGR